MAYQPVEDTAEIVIQATVNGVPVNNTFYARKPGGYTEGELAALAGAVSTHWGTNMRPLCSSAYVYVGCSVRGLANENDFQATSVAGAGVGAVAASPYPNNVAIAIKRSSGLTGRSARGRVYIGGIPVTVSQTDENFLTQGHVDNVEAVLNGIRTVIAVLGWIEVILSRYVDGLKREAGLTFAVTNYQATDLRVDTRRDRLPL